MAGLSIVPEPDGGTQPAFTPVEVVWLDAFKPEGTWVDPTEYTARTCEVHTVGWLWEPTPLAGYVTVVMSFIGDVENPEGISGVFHIPDGAVCRIAALRGE